MYNCIHSYIDFNTCKYIYKNKEYFALFRGHSATGKSYLFSPFKINVFKIHSLKIFNLAQQNLTKLLCKNCAEIRKAYIGYVAIYALFLFKNINNL